jgi:hypothetical protein
MLADFDPIEACRNRARPEIDKTSSRPGHDLPFKWRVVELVPCSAEGGRLALTLEK